MALQNQPKISDFLKICEDFRIEIKEDLLFEEYFTKFYKSIWIINLLYLIVYYNTSTVGTSLSHMRDV